MRRFFANAQNDRVVVRRSFARKIRSLRMTGVVVTFFILTESLGFFGILKVRYCRTCHEGIFMSRTSSFRSAVLSHMYWGISVFYASKRGDPSVVKETLPQDDGVEGHLRKPPNCHPWMSANRHPRKPPNCHPWMSSNRHPRMSANRHPRNLLSGIHFFSLKITKIRKVEKL